MPATNITVERDDAAILAAAKAEVAFLWGKEAHWDLYDEAALSRSIETAQVGVCTAVTRSAARSRNPNVPHPPRVHGVQRLPCRSESERNVMSNPPTSTVGPIVLDADAVRDELHGAPEAHNLTRAQVGRIDQVSDDTIHAALWAAADDDFWAQYDAVRALAITRLADDPLVPIVTVQGGDYEAAVDAANNAGGSVDAVVEHLAQWDCGSETDGAAEVNGHTQLAVLEAWPHQLHEADHRGLHYWLVIDHHLGLYALYRRPLNPCEGV